jgi:hypothetical protein
VGTPKYDRKAVIEKVIQHVRAGNSVTSICRGENGFPTESTFRQWVAEDDDLAAIYARAREARGQHYGERVADLAAKVERGEMDPNAARVAIDAYKWASGRMAPKDFGDKQALEVSGPEGGPLVLKFESKLPAEEE